MSTLTLPVTYTGSGRLRARTWWRMLPLLPRDLALFVLHTYRTLVSPVYGDVCKYYPTCSAYAVGAVQQHGVVKGSVLALLRLGRCHPWAEGGIDDVAPHRHFAHDLTRHGYVVPARED